MLPQLDNTTTAWRIAFATLALALLALGGCATLSKGECLTANWYLIGRNDGAHGYERARLYEHRQACMQYGVWPNAKAYYVGRRKGLASYCTTRNGFREGRAGNPYRGVCPASSEQAFLRGYRKGSALHEVASEIDEVQSEIDSLESRLYDDETDDESRDDIRDRIRSRLRELRYLNRDLNRLRRRFDYDTPYYYDTPDYFDDY